MRGPDYVQMDIAGTAATSPRADAPRPAKRRVNPVAWLFAAVVLVLAAGGIAFYVMHEGGGEGGDDSGSGYPSHNNDPTPTARPDVDPSCACGKGTNCELLPGLGKIGFGFDAVTGKHAHRTVSFSGCTLKYERYLVPDAVEVASQPATDQVFDTRTVRSATQEADHLAVSAGLSVRAGFFSASASVNVAKDTFEASSNYYASASISALRTSYRATLKESAVRADSFALAVSALPEDLASPGALQHYRQFLVEYGTHVLASAMFGGTGTMTSTTKRREHEYKSDKSINAALRAHFLSFTSADATVDKSNKWVEDSSYAETSTYILTSGGDRTLPRTSSPEEWDKWVASVDSDPAMLMSKGFKIRLTPIDEFMTDATEAVRNNTRAAVKAYAAENNNLEDPDCYTEQLPQPCGHQCCPGTDYCINDGCSSTPPPPPPPPPFDYGDYKTVELSGKGSTSETLDSEYQLCFLIDVRGIFKDGERCAIEYSGGVWTFDAHSGVGAFICKAHCIKWPNQPKMSLLFHDHRWDRRGDQQPYNLNGNDIYFISNLHDIHNDKMCSLRGDNIWATGSDSSSYECGAARVSLDNTRYESVHYYDNIFNGQNGDFRRVLIRADDGFCFLTTASAIYKDGERCWLEIMDDHWVVRGTSQQSKYACAASCVRSIDH